MKNPVAPCGANCSLCMAYMRDKNVCHGCNSSSQKAKHCSNCRIKHCAELEGLSSGLCIDCARYPCRRIKLLNSRYLKNYGLDLYVNMMRLSEVGLELFLLEDLKKQTCPKCGTIVSVHHAKCTCGYVMFVKA